jgi:hypothetical protein
MTVEVKEHWGQWIGKLPPKELVNVWGVWVNLKYPAPYVGKLDNPFAFDWDEMMGLLQKHHIPPERYCFMIRKFE